MITKVFDVLSGKFLVLRGRINAATLGGKTAQEFFNYADNAALKVNLSADVISCTSAQLPTKKITKNTYVVVTDNGTISLGNAFFNAIPAGIEINVKASGQLLLSGCDASASSFPVVPIGKREFSILKADKAYVAVSSETTNTL